MEGDETGNCAGTEQLSARALVPIEVASGARTRRTGGRPIERPMAPFLTQLIVSADPSLAPLRTERTRTAAALYARAGGRIV